MPGEAPAPKCAQAATVDASTFRPASPESKAPALDGETRAYAAEKNAILVFTRAGCPNCPPVKDFVSRSGLAAVFVDVDKEEGVALARRHNVMATPTVVGIDASGSESFRALSLVELKAALAQSAAQSAARKEAAAVAC